ncbi:DEAD/DEAH box helicase [Agilicoccus flavus]|uniref:DEAD/DEAH box helicase n=1 Tax=Agilicoccus flavus TaxID=2775968 RepID=UPI001CF63642|nr:DEAD/DEAH box helicase [Agilicoccus flavus]
MPGSPTTSADADAARAAAVALEPGRGRVTHVRRVEPRSGRSVARPEWVHPRLRAALADEGVGEVWAHQNACAQALRDGRHTIVSTGTASGKSLGYLLPILTALAEGADRVPGRGATALYVSPTKALGADQRERVHALGVPGVRAATYDGDTPADERRWIRRHGTYVLTNPDMLHHGILPGHPHWAPFLRSLAYVVLDECHVYRGVFGAHAAALVRRLRRVCALYGADPTFALASATVADPGGLARALVSAQVEVVDDDASPRGATTYVLLDPHGDGVDPPGPPGSDAGDRRGRPTGPGEPTGQGGPGGPAVLGEPDEPTADVGPEAAPGQARGPRPGTSTQAARLLADLARAGVRTAAFARSRAGAEVLAATAQRELADVPDVAARVAAYRGGYLPEDRRALEEALRTGRLLGLATTSALELGIDVSGLDAVVLSGWPGTRTAFRQRAGRAGRRGRSCLVVLVAGEDPLDAYLVAHPEAVLDADVEACVLDPANPYVLGGHLLAAAAEAPLTAEDAAWFGPSTVPLLDDLASRGRLRRRPHPGSRPRRVESSPDADPTGWFWTGRGRPTDEVPLRGTGETVRIVERGTGRVVGTVDAPRADAAVHTGAVHLHQQRPYVVTDLDLSQGAAHVVAGDPGWSTQARSVSAFDLLREQHRAECGPVTLSFGSVTVRSQVTSFVRRTPNGTVLGEHPLDLPERVFHTKGVWWTATPESLAGVGIGPDAVPGAAHAAEHAAIGMLPLLAAVDRWDIGGVSTALHPDTGLPTILVYDGHPGGAGFAERGHALWRAWMEATRDAVAACRCRDGCPSCVQSPKCGNGNSPLDKRGAVALLDLVLAHAPDPPPVRTP